MSTLTNKPALLAVGASLTLLGAWAVAGPSYPTRYHVKITSRTWKGPTREAVKPSGARRQEVWVDGARSRLDVLPGSTGTGAFSVLNDGRGDHIEWRYEAHKKTAELTLPTVSYHYGKSTAPSAWPLGYKPMPAASAVLPLHRIIPHELRRTGLVVKRLGERTRLGRACAIYSVTGYGQRLKESWRQRIHELSTTGKPLPKDAFERDPSRYTEIKAVATIAEGITLWSETFTRNSETRDASQRWSRNIMEVELIELGKPYPIATFQPPPGTTCLISAGVPAPIPPGVKVVRLPANGINRRSVKPVSMRVPGP